MPVRWLPVPHSRLPLPFVEGKKKGGLACKRENGGIGGKGEGRVGHSMQEEL